MRFILLSLGMSLSFLSQRTDAGPVDGLDYQSESVATADKITSGIFNPAGLGFWNSMGIHYAHGFTDSTYKGDDGLLISSHGGFFSVEWLNHSDDIFRRKYTLATGDRVFRDFYLGVSYSWFGGSNLFYQGRKDWKIGLLYHPRPFASLGLVVDRLNEPKFGAFKQKRLYQPGIAFRPLGDKLTFSADGRLTEGSSLTDLQGSLRIAAGPFSGISMSVDYRTEGQWRLGLTLNLGRSRIGTQGAVNSSHGFQGGSYFLELGEVRYSSSIGPGARIGTITLRNDIVEEPRQNLLFGSGRRSFFSIVRSLRKGAADPRIEGLLVKIDGLRLDFADVQELRSAVSEYRANGKKVTVFMTQGGNLGYYLASACDEIYMDPTGLLELYGLAATATFYKGTMDKLGIRAEIVRTGPHKTYGDAFTDTAFTQAAREQVDWLLDDLYQQFVDAISAGRGILPDSVKSLIDAGPYTAQDAYKAGLIDGLKHYDELVNDEEWEFLARYANLGEFYKFEDYNARWSEPKTIAIVYADGSIVQGQSGSSFLEGRTVGSATLARTLRRVARDEDIKAVVFRVNSPGGDIFASEEIYRQLELLKGKKPLVVSMGGVAASGGYYISCPGDEILASPATITGSIGVIMGKADLSGFYRKIGVGMETIKRGTHADIRSTARPATKEEMDLAEKMLWEYYDDFISKVTTWRLLDYDSVNAIGQGRVWTGHQALERGLIDGYGGIWEAVDEARQKAGIDPLDKLVIEAYPVYGFSLRGSIGTPSLESQISAFTDKVEDGSISYRMPFDLKIR